MSDDLLNALEAIAAVLVTLIARELASAHLSKRRARRGWGEDVEDRYPKVHIHPAHKKEEP